MVASQQMKRVCPWPICQYCSLPSMFLHELHRKWAANEVKEVLRAPHVAGSMPLTAPDLPPRLEVDGVLPAL